jgi:membrane-associated phospholipid phosphatase
VLLPIVVAASRLILGVHYPTDVLTSLVLGSLVSASAYCLSAPEEFAEKATR